MLISLTSSPAVPGLSALPGGRGGPSCRRRHPACVVGCGWAGLRAPGCWAPRAAVPRINALAEGVRRPSNV